jgi:hypothetical protein
MGLPYEDAPIWHTRRAVAVRPVTAVLLGRPDHRSATLPATIERTPADRLQAGRDALARGACQDALVCFKAALEDEVTPEALEGYGMAAWWLEDIPAVMSAREEAYRGFRRRQDRPAAARMATWLANDYADYKGELAVANGWIRLAERYLDGQPRGPEHAFLAYTKAHFALMVHRDPAEARRWSAEAAEIGRTIGPADFELLGVALEGLAMVTEGAVADGLGRLDEASAAVTAGEITDPCFIGVACCYLIRACEQVRDYDRAAQWCQRVREFCERWNYPMLSAPAVSSTARCSPLGASGPKRSVRSMRCSSTSPRSSLDSCRWPRRAWPSSSGSADGGMKRTGCSARQGPTCLPCRCAPRSHSTAGSQHWPPSTPMSTCDGFPPRAAPSGSTRWRP